VCPIVIALFACCTNIMIYRREGRTNFIKINNYFLDQMIDYNI